jgi:hypothetical protein
VTQDHVPFCKAIGNSVHVWGAKSADEEDIYGGMN